jgi:thiol-disulfide isomerase/thioredoxin
MTGKGADALDIQSELSMPGVKLLVVEFYATWCKPCMEAVPKWQELHSKYRKSGLRFIVVSAEEDGTCSEPPNWSPDKTVCDGDESIRKRLGVRKLPQSFLYSWEGNIAMTSHEVSPVGEAIQRYFKDTHLKMLVDQVEVIGDKCAVSGNPDWYRELVSARIREASKFDLVGWSAVFIPPSTSATCDPVFPPNSVLRIKLDGDCNGNRSVTLKIEKDGCQLAAASEPFFGTGLNEDRGSMEKAAGRAVWNLLSQIVGGKLKKPKLVGAGADDEDWFLKGGEQVVVKFEPRPANALVLIDGFAKCKTTPCSISVPKGIHEVSLQLEEYLPETRRITFERDETIDWDLRPNFGWLAVSTKDGAIELLVDGKKPTSVTGGRLKVPPGPHELAFVSPCHHEHRESVVIRRGEEVRVDAELKRKEGGLDISAVDEKGNVLRADIFIDGTKLGTTPDRLKVSVCARDLEVKHGGAKFTKKLEIMEKTVENIVARLNISNEPVYLASPGWIAGATLTAGGAAIMVIGGVFTYTENTWTDAFKKASTNDKMTQSRDNAKLYNGLAISSYVIGSIAIVSGIITWATSPRYVEVKKTGVVGLTPVITPEFIGAGAAGVW